MNKKLMLPMTTKDTIIQDKKFPYKLYAKITLESNRNEVEEHRYIKNSKLKSNEMKEQLKAIGISESTFKRQINKLKKYTDVIELVQLEDGVAYKIKYKDCDNRNYVLVNAEKLRIIINSSKTARILPLLQVGEELLVALAKRYLFQFLL